MDEVVYTGREGLVAPSLPAIPRLLDSDPLDHRRGHHTVVVFGQQAREVDSHEVGGVASPALCHLDRAPV